MSDAVIVGSGPAGLSAALYLSSHGMEVTVIERLSDSRYPVYHSICGMGISDKAFGMLELIEPTDVRNRIGHTTFVFPGGTVVTLKTSGYVLDRVAFLLHLRERCVSRGCTFVNGRVSSVERTESGFRVNATTGAYDCRYVIGCDGAHSVVRRELFGSKPAMIAAQEFIVDIPAEDDAFRITLGERYKGLYEWSFPSGDRMNVGSGVGIINPDNAISKGARNIPYGGAPRISDGNAYICGDAAGMANPVSGGGLMAAMVSGQNAAREIVTGKRGSYQRWWDRSILSSPRFMGFKRTLEGWTDEDLIKSSKPFRNGRNPHLWGVIAGILHPKYIPMYIGCLKTIKHTW